MLQYIAIIIGMECCELWALHGTIDWGQAEDETGKMFLLSEFL